MIGTSNAFKLAELRVKTDRELVRIIDKELDLGIDLALAAEAKLSREFRLPESPHVRAQKTYAQAITLLIKVEDVVERRRLGGKLTHLREMLDGHRVHAVQRA